MTPIDLQLFLETINLPKLILKVEVGKDHNGAAFHLVKGVDQVREVLVKIEETGLFESQIDRLRNGLLFINYPDELRLDLVQYNSITEKLNSIRFGIEGIMEYFRSLSENSYPDEILNIRLPQTDDFDTLAKSIEELKKIITLPLLTPGIDATTKIMKGDEGSVVLVVAFVGTLEAARRAYRFIAEIQWSSHVIAKKKAEAAMADVFVQSMELDLSVKKAVTEGKEQLIKQYLALEAKSIFERFELGDDQENLKRLELAITTLDKFHQKGGELLPGPFAPEDVKNLFPPKDKTYLVESRVGKLSEGNQEQ